MCVCARVFVPTGGSGEDYYVTIVRWRSMTGPFDLDGFVVVGFNCVGPAALLRSIKWHSVDCHANDAQMLNFLDRVLLIRAIEWDPNIPRKLAERGRVFLVVNPMVDNSVGDDVPILVTGRGVDACGTWHDVR